MNYDCFGFPRVGNDSNFAILMFILTRMSLNFILFFVSRWKVFPVVPCELMWGLDFVPASTSFELTKCTLRGSSLTIMIPYFSSKKKKILCHGICPKLAGLWALTFFSTSDYNCSLFLSHLKPSRTVHYDIQVKNILEILSYRCSSNSYFCSDIPNSAPWTNFYWDKEYHIISSLIS